MDAGIARDDLAELTGKLRAALGQADLLVTTGGVSMGDRDLLRQVPVQCIMYNVHHHNNIFNIVNILSVN